MVVGWNRIQTLLNGNTQSKTTLTTKKIGSSLFSSAAHIIFSNTNLKKTHGNFTRINFGWHPVGYRMVDVRSKAAMLRSIAQVIHRLSRFVVVQVSNCYLNFFIVGQWKISSIVIDWRTGLIMPWSSLSIYSLYHHSGPYKSFLRSIFS